MRLNEAESEPSENIATCYRSTFIRRENQRNFLFAERLINFDLSINILHRTDILFTTLSNTIFNCCYIIHNIEIYLIYQIYFNTHIFILYKLDIELKYYTLYHRLEIYIKFII